MNCSLYRPNQHTDGRITVVPSLKWATVESITGWVRNGGGPGDTTERVAEVRAAVASGDEAAKTLAKSLLWSFTPSGVVAMRSDRSKTGIRWASRTRLVAIDCDHLTGAERLRDEMATLPETVSAWVSASGQGVKMLLLADGVGETAEAFHRAWFAARGYLEQLGYVPQIDVPGSYWNGIQFLSRDPGAYYNAEAEPLRVDDYPAPPADDTPQKAWSPSYAPLGKPTAAEVSQMLDFVKPPDLHWMGGSGEITVLHMANALWDWGGDAAEGLFYDWLARVGYDRHNPADAWRKARKNDSRVTLGSLLHWAKAGGWQPPWRPKRAPMRPTPKAEEEDPEDWMK